MLRMDSMRSEISFSSKTIPTIFPAGVTAGDSKTVLEPMTFIWLSCARSAENVEGENAIRIANKCSLNFIVVVSW